MGRPLGAKDKVKREGHSGKNLPNNMKKYVEATQKKEEISRIIGESVKYFKRKPCKDNAEIAERLNAYFNECWETGQIPTIEDMALALGITRQTLWRWSQEVNQDRERAEMIEHARAILAAIDAKLVTEGKIIPVTYIFRAKNYYDMKDQNEVVLTPNVDPLGEAVDEEKLKQKYLESTYGLELPEKAE